MIIDEQVIVCFPAHCPVDKEGINHVTSVFAQLNQGGPNMEMIMPLDEAKDRAVHFMNKGYH